MDALTIQNTDNTIYRNLDILIPWIHAGFGGEWMISNSSSRLVVGIWTYIIQEIEEYRKGELVKQTPCYVTNQNRKRILNNN